MPPSSDAGGSSSTSADSSMAGIMGEAYEIIDAASAMHATSALRPGAGAASGSVE